MFSNITENGVIFYETCKWKVYRQTNIDELVRGVANNLSIKLMFSFFLMARRDIPMIAFQHIYIYCLCHIRARLCIVYIVKEAASFQGLGQLMVMAYIECMMKLYRSTGRQLPVDYVETGTNICSA